MPIAIEKFQEQGGRLKTDDLDFESFRTQPLSPQVLRCLGYMHDIEYQTVLYTRELLVTPAWKDPQFTAFLTLAFALNDARGTAAGPVSQRLAAARFTGDRTIMPWSQLAFAGGGNNASADVVVKQRQADRAVTVFPPKFATGAPSFSLLTGRLRTRDRGSQIAAGAVLLQQAEHSGEGHQQKEHVCCRRKGVIHTTALPPATKPRPCEWREQYQQRRDEEQHPLLGR